MISWLQSTLQKHYKWLFTILLGVIIVAFVFTIGASPGIGRTKAKMAKSLFYGVDLNSEDAVRALMTEASLSTVLHTGQPIYYQAQAEQALLQRASLLHLADSYNVPAPTDLLLTLYIQTVPMFLDAKGSFDAAKYEEFLKMAEKDPNLPQSLIRQTLSNDQRIETILKTVRGPGYVLPFEAQFELEKVDTKWSIELAQYDYANFKPEIKLSKEELNLYYEQNKQKYARPQNVSVSCLFFSPENYLTKVKAPTDAELEAYFDKNKGLFANSKDEVPALAAVKTKVLETYKHYKAERLAAEDAFNFAYEVFDSKVERTSPHFAAMLKKYNAEKLDLPKYDEANLLPDNSLPEALLRQAFELTRERFLSDVISVSKGRSALIVLNDKEESIVEPFESVEKTVEADMLMVKKAELFVVKAEELQKELAQDLATEKNFKAKAESLGLTVQSFKDFSIKTAPEGFNPRIFAEMIALPKHGLSKMVPLDTKVFYVYVVDKNQPSIAIDSKEVKDAFADMKPLAAEASGYAAIEELIQKGIQKITGNKAPQS